MEARRERKGRYRKVEERDRKKSVEEFERERELQRGKDRSMPLSNMMKHERKGYKIRKQI